MTCALRLVQWIVRDSGCDEGAVVIITGAVAVEADFPRYGNHVVRRVSMDRGKIHLLVGKGIISSHSGVRYVSILGFKILSSKILFPALVFAFSTSQRICSIRPEAMKFA